MKKPDNRQEVPKQVQRAKPCINVNKYTKNIDNLPHAVIIVIENKRMRRHLL
ncbi:MAG: hypothetical protein HFH32_02465 [Eubacterium sp.]|nr:hypothetical protein [Eubacterium sp.]